MEIRSQIESSELTVYYRDPEPPRFFKNKLNEGGQLLVYKKLFAGTLSNNPLGNIYQTSITIMAPHAVDSPHGFHSISGSERKRSISILDEASNWAGISLTVSSFIVSISHTID